jgi:hypothetical protein
VASVHVNPLQMDLSRSVVDVSRTLLWPAGVFLLLLVALVVGNTVKLSLLARADEVAILRLVGAKTWYIRLPLLAGGVAQGLAGAGMALGLLKVLQHSLADVLDVPPLWIRIVFPMAPDRGRALPGPWPVSACQLGRGQGQEPDHRHAASSPLPGSRPPRPHHPGGPRFPRLPEAWRPLRALRPRVPGSSDVLGASGPTKGEMHRGRNCGPLFGSRSVDAALSCYGQAQLARVAVQSLHVWPSGNSPRSCEGRPAR